MVEKTLTVKSADIKPYYFGYESCSSGHSYGPAVRNCWLLHYVVKGKGVYKIHNKEYSLDRGNIFIIPPFEKTYYRADDNDPWEYIWVAFTKSEDMYFPKKDVIYIPEAERIFKDIKDCCDMEKGRNEMVISRIWELFSLFSEEPSENTDYVSLALEIIHSEYSRELTVGDIANRIGLERTYFSVIFKNSMGISPKEYIITFKIQQAAELIKNHGFGVSVAAASVGYRDAYAFSKIFKKYYGVTPDALKAPKSRADTQ